MAGTTHRGWALVVGGSRGLGAACALKLAASGRPIVLTYRSDAHAAESVRQRALEGGAPAARTLLLDVHDPANSEQSVAALIDEVGPHQCLVHSAAELLRASVEETDIAAFNRVLTANCTSAYAIARTCGLAMRAAGGGSITLLSSVIGPFGVRDRVAYATSKAGLIGMTKALAVELAPTVRVNAITLGTFATDLTEALQADPAALRLLAARVPLQRLGDPDEVGTVVALLAQEASFVTGAVWEIDGGITARLATPAGDTVR